MGPRNAHGYPPPYTQKTSKPGSYGKQKRTYRQPQPAGYWPSQSMTTTNTVVVTQPTAAMVPVGARPRDHMTSAVFACLCCFWPTGVCAIYYASQANSAAAAGDMVSAQSHANTARNLIIASVVIGIICIVVVIVLRVTVLSA